MSIRDRYRPGGDKYESIKTDLIDEKIEEERQARIEHAEQHGREIDVWEAKNVE